jgi:hypothetical protein
VRIVTWKRAAAAAAALLVLCAGRPVTVVASDHADPQVLRDADGNITDLFFFPDGDRYVVIFNVHRSLTALPPFELAKYEYRINFDWHTGVSFVNGEQDTVRYGGKISHPEGIKEDATITIRLDNALQNDANHMGFAQGWPKYTGLRYADQIRPWAGLRADPFIFPRFFKKNVISMVFSLPRNAFPPGRDAFLIWGAAFKDGKQVDHVGRSNRTQQARFESLNTLHPSQHVAQILKDQMFWDKWYAGLSKYRETQPLGAAIQILIQIRANGPNHNYDLAPDVMVYSDAREHDPAVRPGFPNGRHIQDDVAGLTCAEGDCILQELAFVEGGWPRSTVSDKPVPKLCSTDPAPPCAAFPYLLDPYPDPAPNKLPSPLPRLGVRGIFSLGMLIVTSVPRLIELELLPVNTTIVVLVILLVVVMAAIEIWLVWQAVKYRALRRQQRELI